MTDPILTFKDGTEMSFSKLYEIYRDSLISAAILFVKQREVAEDIVAETFQNTLMINKQFDDQQKFCSYVSCSTKYACFTHIRKEKKRKKVNDDLGYLLDETEDNLLERKERTKQLQLIKETILELPTNHSKLLLLFYEMGCRAEDVAKITGIGRKNLRMQKSRALNALKIKLQNKPAALR